MNPPDDFDPPIGVPQHVAARTRRIVAPNPSAMTYRGTNTYLVGETDLAIIDPGPDSKAHLDAILSAITPGQRVTHIIVTHSHIDHSPLASALSQQTGAPIYAYGDAFAGRSSVMQELAKSGEIGGGEGIDTSFRPDLLVKCGDSLKGPDWQLDVIHTPGHLGNHICLGMGSVCFTADHIMGWASSLVSPPDGDLTDFMASCEKLQQRSWSMFLPGHGDTETNPTERLTWLIAHRKQRKAEILAALSRGSNTARALAEEIYQDTPKALLGAATRNVLAHLIDLTQSGRVSYKDALHPGSEFKLNARP